MKNLSGALNRLFLPVIFFAGLLISCTKEAEKDLSKGMEVVLRLPPGPENMRNSEGDFIGLKDGNILFIYTHFGSGGRDFSKAHLASRVSGDGGKTWSHEDKMVIPNEGAMNIMSVSLLRLKNGKIALFYLRKNSEQDCIPYMRLSEDEARSWSEPVRCIPDSGYFVMNNDRVIQLKSGRLILPVSLHTNENGEFVSRGKIFTYYSDDLKIWNRSKEAGNPEQAVTQEPGAVELKDGRIMMFCRTDSNVQYITYSADGGESWSDLEPGNFRSPMSPASIERIPSTGDLLLVWNDNVQKGAENAGRRTPFNVAVSKDEGKTWIKKKVIESNPFGWYCYTALYFTSDYVLVGHCSDDLRKTGSLQTTEVDRLSLDWIYADQTPDPYIVSDDKGIVELADPDPHAVIHYTVDGSLPGDGHAMKYDQPFKIEKSTVLFMEAVAEGKTRGNLIKAFVGKDLFEKPVKLSGEAVPGLSYICYRGRIKGVEEIKDLKPEKSGEINTIDCKACDLDSDYAVVFTGYIRIPEDGLYHFWLDSNDGSVLYIDGDLIINNDFPHSYIEMKGISALKAGFHRVELKYFQQGGGMKLKLYWSGPGMEKEEIPAGYFYHEKGHEQ